MKHIKITIKHTVLGMSLLLGVSYLSLRSRSDHSCGISPRLIHVGQQLSFSWLDVMTLLAPNSYTLLIYRINSNNSIFKLIDCFMQALDVHHSARLFSTFVNGSIFQNARGVLNFATSLRHCLFQCVLNTDLHHHHNGWCLFPCHDSTVILLAKTEI
jgi:hypothetical protein